MNLPGSLDRRPYFNSPYHYRLDWEVWIHTTASYLLRELHRNRSTRFTPEFWCKVYIDIHRNRYEGKTGPLPVPGFITELGRRIMQGDTDAMGLVAPQTAGLLLPFDSQDAKAKLAAPTAIRARYFKYTFTDPGSGDWWKREPLPGDKEKLFLPPSDAEMAGKAPPRRSPYSYNQSAVACNVWAYFDRLVVSIGRTVHFCC